MGKKLISFVIAAITISTAVFSTRVQAQSSGFAIQVSPSPIVETIKPGTTKVVELKIRNQSSQPETLKMGMRDFEVDESSGQVNLLNNEPKDVTSWVTFANPIFAVSPGEWFTQRITFAVPANAGFTYAFAITVSRANPVKEQGGKTAIEGSVAVFTLLSTNRPDAVRKLDVVSFKSAKKVYEYLPATFTLQLKNSGNTIIQPAGNIYVQRDSNSTSPLAVMPVNEKTAYILPNVTRSLTVDWNNGFPVYKKNAEGKSSLLWDWSTVQNFRFGHFVAKAVVVYNDGQRDVPTIAEIDFWVIPWKMLAVVLIFIALIVVGVVTIIRKTMRAVKKKQTHEEKE